jgi:hypothetical protein
VALAVTVALGLAAGSRALWNAHQRAQRNHAQAELRARYLSAEAALAKLMPADVTTEVCEGTRSCGFSKLNPPQVAVQLERVLPGSKLVASRDEYGCPGGTCQAVVEGRFDGFEAVGVAFSHLLVLPADRTPPRGAIEWHSTLHRHRPGDKRGFWLGSNVALFVREPTSLESEE